MISQPKIEKIARLDRHTLGELILRNGESLRPQPACWHCEQPQGPLFPYNGKILCTRDLSLELMGRLPW